MTLIECDINPDDLISDIGDRAFSICDNEYSDGFFNHPNHPHTLRIICCEDSTYIDVYNDMGIEETRIAAQALLKLLNQNYERKK